MIIWRNWNLKLKNSIFGINSSVVSFHTDQKDILDWVQNYLGDFFRYPETTDIKWEIYVYSDRFAYQRVCDEFHILATDKLEVGDENSFFSYFKLSNSYLVIRQRDPDTLGSFWYWKISFEKKKIEAWVHRNDIESLYNSARLIRSCLIFESLNEGWIQLHASCFRFQDKGFIILGNKGCGKTTFLLKALLKLKGSFVSNDRILIKTIGDEIWAQGLPYSIGIRNTTIESLKIDKLLDKSEYYFNYGGKTKTRFLVNELVKKLHFPVQQHIQIDAAIFPEYDYLKMSFSKLRQRTLNNKIRNFKINDVCSFQPIWNMFVARDLSDISIDRIVGYNVNYNDENIETLLKSIHSKL